LANLKTKEERDEYIVDCLKKSYRDDFNDFTKKHNAKALQAKNFEKKFEQNKLNSKKEKVDIFKWLNISTP